MPKEYVPVPNRFHVMQVDYMAHDIGDKNAWELIGSYKTKGEARRIEAMMDREVNLLGKKFIFFIEESEPE